MAEPARQTQEPITTVRRTAVDPDVLLEMGPLQITRDARRRSLVLSLDADAPEALHRALARCREVRARVGGFAGLVVFREGFEPGSYLIHTQLVAHAGQVDALGWTLERRLELFTRVARSVQGLHEVGETMGVLSPQHVLLNSGELPHVLGPGVVVHEGCAYRSPESRESGRDDVASDIYCLGALLHFLVSGEAPPCQSSTDALPLFAAVSPRGLRRIVRKACSPTPEQRYENVYELLFDLARHADAEGVGLDHSADVRREGSGARRLNQALRVRPAAAE